MAPSDPTSHPPEDDRRGDADPGGTAAGSGRVGGAYPSGLAGDVQVREERIDRGPSGMLVSPLVRSDSGGPLPAEGLDRDSGAGAAAGHDTGGREASRGARAALRADASTGTTARAPSLASAWQRLRRWDAERDSLPGEHWAALAAGAWLFTRRPGSALLRLACLAGGAALLWRAASGRDGLRAQWQARRSGTAPPERAPTPARRPAAQPDDLPPSPHLAGSLEGVPWVDRRE